jgi:hypothetical protein
MTAPAYPAILTAADWNAKKGAFVKLLPNTKLGDALRKLQDTAAKIHWDTLFHVPGVSATVTRRGASRRPRLPEQNGNFPGTFPPPPPFSLMPSALTPKTPTAETLHAHPHPHT